MDQEKVRGLFSEIMSEGLGLDLSDPNLLDTPERVAYMYCNEFFRSVDKEFKNFKVFPNVCNYDQIIMSDKIHFVSMCSHHFLPFSGLAWILYIPGDKLVGASKMARLVEHYAARPQLQENLCHEVLNSFVLNVEPSGTMVVMRAIHECMSCRGVNQYGGSGLGTSAIYGSFVDNPSTKQEGLELIKLSLMV